MKLREVLNNHVQALSAQLLSPSLSNAVYALELLCHADITSKISCATGINLSSATCSFFFRLLAESGEFS
jgi:hypothetical protein